MWSFFELLPDYAEVPEHFWPVTLAAAAISYFILVRLLRYRAVNNLLNTYPAFVKDPYSMDYKTAHEITKLYMLYDTPWMFGFGTTWALIKTYGIASGTPLPVKTRQLTSDATVRRRAEDTRVLISEFVIGNMDDERGLRALSKVNWLHGRYGSKIGNDEMIHTLAMFVLEPHRWIERFEWRPLTDLEKVAHFIHWKEIGNRMGIRDLPPTLKELQAWTDKFEETHMVYSDNNRICAETTTRMYLKNVPGPLKRFAQLAAASLLEDKVRVAVGSEEPPQWIQQLVYSILNTRGFMIRHFFLPRLRAMDVLATPGPDGRLQRKVYGFEPWYLPDTLSNRRKTWLASGGKLLRGRNGRVVGIYLRSWGQRSMRNRRGRLF